MIIKCKRNEGLVEAFLFNKEAAIEIFNKPNLISHLDLTLHGRFTKNDDGVVDYCHYASLHSPERMIAELGDWVVKDFGEVRGYTEDEFYRFYSPY